MKKIIQTLTLATLLALSQATIAQSSTDIFSEIIGSEPTVEINLGSIMLGLLSSATENQEQGISNILSGLDSIKVTVFELENGNTLKLIKSKINQLSNIKAQSGYEKIATVREDDSLVYVLAKMDKKHFKSLSIFALDDEDELVLIDIDGTILLSQLGDLMEHFDVDLDINGMKFKNQKKKH